MTSVMLATYPDIFAGGAIIAGLPYSGASSLLQALYNMKGFWASDQQLDALVRGASKNVDEWPTISVWHGSDDRTVDPSNADATVRQWQPLHCVEGTPTRTEIVDGHARRVWCDAGGREVIEEYRITKMGHGAPLRTGGAEGYGAPGDHMLEVAICSTNTLRGFWGLIDQKKSVEEKCVLGGVAACADVVPCASVATRWFDRMKVYRIVALIASSWQPKKDQNCPGEKLSRLMPALLALRSLGVGSVR